MDRTFLPGAALAILALLTPLRAAAQDEVRDTLKVHARVVAQCVIHADDLDFGTYSATEGAEATSFVSVRCTPGVKADIALNGGEGGDVRARRMSGPDTLTYQLFIDPGRRTVFGDRRVDETAHLKATGLWQRIPVYGRAPAGQALWPGSYRDVVSATIVY